MQVDERPNNQLGSGANKSPGRPGHSIEDSHVLGGRNLRDNRVNIRDEGLLVLDKQMPEIDGLELQKILIASGHKIPVIFITAHNDENSREVAIDSGAIAYLEKPLDDQVLLDAIGGWCTMNSSHSCPCPVRPA